MQYVIEFPQIASGGSDGSAALRAKIRLFQHTQLTLLEGKQVSV